MARKKKILTSINNNQTWLDMIHSRYSFTAEDCVLGTKNIPNSYNSLDSNTHTFISEDNHRQDDIPNELINNAIKFTSDTGYTTSFSNNAEKSISLWFMIYELGHGNWLLGNDNWHFYITDNKLGFWITTLATSIDISQIENNKWYNLCISYSNSLLNIYLNGKYITQFEYENFTTDPLFVGNNMTNNYIGGPIYFINKAITAEEVKEIYGIKTKIIQGKKLYSQSIVELVDSEISNTDPVNTNPIVYANGTIAIKNIEEDNETEKFVLSRNALKLKRTTEEEVFEEI